MCSLKHILNVSDIPGSELVVADIIIDHTNIHEVLPQVSYTNIQVGFQT